MKYCEKCGFKIKDDVKFCVNCGEKQIALIQPQIQPQTLQENANITNANTKNPGFGLGIAAIVCAGLSLIPFGTLIAVVGVILGVLSNMKSKKTGTYSAISIAGIISNAVCFFISIFITIIVAAITIPLFLNYTGASSCSSSLMDVKIAHNTVSEFVTESNARGEYVYYLCVTEDDGFPNGRGHGIPNVVVTFESNGWNIISVHTNSNNIVHVYPADGIRQYIGTCPRCYN
ncbi:MAG: zinc ribbon domain-containing protein [Oscillospiraceae bacterium]|nr:zinc ribbon domain-containing protein [Oscillospiraceae bacterium]